MSVPGPEPAQAAEDAATAAPAAAGKADRWSDPRLPWQGKARTADILCWLGIVLSGVFYWALLPLRVSLLGTHPVWAELLNGSTESIISAAAFARTGDGTLAVVLLAAIPGLMKFDVLYWWAGRLWGERFLMALPGSRRLAKHMARVERYGRKFTWPAVLVSSFLPIPRAIIFVIAGWAGMRLVTFLVLDLIGVLLWAGLLAGLGYAIGHDAVAAAKTISHYSWWVTLGIVVLSVVLTVLSQRRPADQNGG
jgi:membrane-associated protein